MPQFLNLIRLCYVNEQGCGVAIKPCGVTPVSEFIKRKEGMVCETVRFV